MKKNEQQKQASKTGADSLKRDIASSNNGWLLLIAGLIALVTFLCFSQVSSFEFSNWDDNAYVFSNPHLAKPLPEAVTYFFGPHYFIGNYIPITMTVYTLQQHWAGLDPHVYHSVNLFIHLLNVLLMFWFIYLLSGKKPVVAAFVALFFGIHPMHVESVAWVAELKDLLYTFFFISGLIAYHRHVDLRQRPQETKGGMKFLGFSLVFFIFSILSKPAAVVFPVVLILLDFYYARKQELRTWVEKLPFFIISVVFGIIAIKAQQADNLLHDVHPLSHRLLFASYSLISYLVKFFVPVNLSIFYPYPVPVEGSLPSLYYFAPLGLLALLYGAYKMRHSRLVVFGLLFFFANVVLVLQLVSFGDAMMAERYTYLSYTGLLFIAGMSIDKVYHDSRQSFKTYRVAVSGLLAIIIIAFGYLTQKRSKVWQNDNLMSLDLLNKYPDDHLVLNNRGYILYEQKMYNDAIDLYKRAVQLKPDYSRAYVNLLNAYINMNDLNSAVKITDTALAHMPDNVIFLNQKGYFLSGEGKYPEAISFFKKAIALKKDNIYGYMRIAETYYMLKDYDSGIKALNTALGYAPNDYILLNNKGYILLAKKQYKEAIDHFKASLNIKPDFQTASINLSDCYKAMADTSGIKK